MGAVLGNSLGWHTNRINQVKQLNYRHSSRLQYIHRHNWQTKQSRHARKQHKAHDLRTRPQHWKVLRHVSRNSYEAVWSNLRPSNSIPIQLAPLNWLNILQTVGTASLLFSVMTVVDQKNLNIPKALQPLILAFVICVHAIAFGFNEGAPLNPARDLGPRIFCSWVVYGKEAFTWV